LLILFKCILKITKKKKKKERKLELEIVKMAKIADFIAISAVAP
jgi:hypothetical protein